MFKINQMLAFCAFTSLFLLSSCQNNTAANTADSASKSGAKATINWHCIGTEPFWGVEISVEKNTATFDSPDKKEEPIALTAISETPDIATYTGKNITIAIKKEKCGDGMSDNEFEYSSIVEFDTHKFNGCATKK